MTKLLSRNAVAGLMTLPFIIPFLQPPQPAQAPVLAPIQTYKMVSYFPIDSRGMWSDWNATAIDNDFSRLASLHATAVRVFLQPSEFGYPNPQPAMLSELAQVVQMAAQHGMKTYFNLFDGFWSFGDIYGSRTWAKAIVAPYAGGAHAAAFEVFNEMNPANTEAVAWASTMIPYIQSIAAGTPVGISVNQGWKLKNLKGSLGSHQPDFYSFHYYTSLENAQDHGASDIAGDAAVAAPHPLIVGETGFPTWNGVFGSGSGSSSAQEADQSSYIAAVEQAAMQVGVGRAGIYTQNDFSSTQIPEDERYFGLYRTDGTPKAAVQTLSTYF